MSEMATGLVRFRNYHANFKERYPFDEKLYTEETAKEVQRIFQIWETCRANVKERLAKRGESEKDEGFLFGRFGIVDAMFCPLMFRIQTYNLFGKIEGENCREYVQHMLNLAPMKEWETEGIKENINIPEYDFYPSPMP
jgi:glutathione S-transferase